MHLPLKHQTTNLMFLNQSFILVIRNAYSSAIAAPFSSLFGSSGNTLLLLSVKVSSVAAAVGCGGSSHQCPFQDCSAVSQLLELVPLPVCLPIQWSQERSTIGREPYTALSNRSEYAKWVILFALWSWLLDMPPPAVLFFLQSAALWCLFQMVGYGCAIYHLYMWQFLLRSFSQNKIPAEQPDPNTHFIQPPWLQYSQDITQRRVTLNYSFFSACTQSWLIFRPISTWHC